MIEFLGELLDIKFDKSQIQIGVDFLTPELFAEFQDLIESKKTVKFCFNTATKVRVKTKKQQSQFWLDFYKIMKYLEIEVNKDNTKVFYYDVIKPNVFPVKYKRLGDKEYPHIPSMMELTIEEMADVIQRQRDYYSYLNIVWDKIND